MAIADATPPSHMPLTQLAEFYFQRTAAAGQIGRTPQRLADARAALEIGLAANLPFTRLNAFRNALVTAELAAGHPKSAFNERLAQLHAARQFPPGHSFSILTLLAIQSSTGLGRLDDAAQYLARAKQILGSLRDRLPELEGDDTRLVAAAEGQIALASGRFSDAERAYRRGIAGMERFLTVYDQLDTKRLGLAPKYIYQQNVHMLRSGLSESLLGQGRVIEAEIEARTALSGSLSVVGRSSGETMILLLRFTNVLLEQWRLSEVEHLTRAAIGQSLASGIESSSRIVAAARSQLARVLGFQERFDEQVAEFSALTDGRSSESTRHRVCHPWARSG